VSEVRRVLDSHFAGLVYTGSSGIHGTGLFAARRIRRGEYIGTFHGPLARRDGSHVLWVYPAEGDGDPVGRRGRNPLRYLNHSDRPNAVFDGFDLYARRSIAQDDEITIDYGNSGD
jgi:SET domain-containing protein